MEYYNISVEDFEKVRKALTECIEEIDAIEENLKECSSNTGEFNNFIDELFRQATKSLVDKNDELFLRSRDIKIEIEL